MVHYWVIIRVLFGPSEGSKMGCAKTLVGSRSKHPFLGALKMDVLSDIPGQKGPFLGSWTPRVRLHLGVQIWTF